MNKKFKYFFINEKNRFFLFSIFFRGENLVEALVVRRGVLVQRDADGLHLLVLHGNRETNALFIRS